MKKKNNVCILCNDKYGIFYGDVKKYNPVTRVAVVAQCRHVSWWYGRTGGITSLARYGLCGPNKANSRVGAPTDRPSVLTGIVNVFPASSEAQKTFDECVPHV